MKKDTLLASAQQLKQPAQAHAHAYAEQAEALAAMVTAQLLARPDLETLIGPGNEEMMADNHRNHARFLSSVFQCYRPEVLVETVLWVYRAYRAHGFHLTYWPAQLDCWVKCMRETLPAASVAELYPFYEWLLINQAAFVELTDK